MDFMSQLRDSQEKAELAVARGENMTMKILDLQKSLMCAEREEARLKKQLEKTRAERDAAREDAQKKTPPSRNATSASPRWSIALPTSNFIAMRPTAPRPPAPLPFPRLRTSTIESLLLAR